MMIMSNNVVLRRKPEETIIPQTTKRSTANSVAKPPLVKTKLPTLENCTPISIVPIETYHYPSMKFRDSTTFKRKVIKKKKNLFFVCDFVYHQFHKLLFTLLHNSYIHNLLVL